MQRAEVSGTLLIHKAAHVHYVTCCCGATCTGTASLHAAARCLTSPAARATRARLCASVLATLVNMEAQ